MPIDHLMNYDSFINLSIIEKDIYAREHGRFIDAKVEGNFKVLLFEVRTFYVEIVCDIENEVIQIRNSKEAFKDFKSSQSLVKKHSILNISSIETILSNIYSVWLYEEMESQNQLFNSSPGKNTGKFYWGFLSRVNGTILEVNHEINLEEIRFECVDKVYKTYDYRKGDIPIALIFKLTDLKQSIKWLPDDFSIRIESHYIVKICRELIIQQPEKYSVEVFINTYNLEDFKL